MKLKLLYHLWMKWHELTKLLFSMLPSDIRDEVAKVFMSLALQV
jgi:hypothetical protein